MIYVLGTNETVLSSSKPCLHSYLDYWWSLQRWWGGVWIFFIFFVIFEISSLLRREAYHCAHSR